MKLIAITTISATVYLLFRFFLLKIADEDYWKAFLVGVLGVLLVIFLIQEWRKDLKEYQEFYNQKRQRRNR